MRPRLCTLAQPCLRQPQSASNFRFFDATLLLIRSGRLSFDDGAAMPQADGALTLVAVPHNTCADLQKVPGGGDQTFRSLFLALAPEVIEEFYLRYEHGAATSPTLGCYREVPLDADLGDTFEHCIRAIDGAAASDRIVMHRLLGLLLALAERGVVFARPASHTVGKLLTALLAAAPGAHWTAAKACRELAMSEATLRRRLAAEHVRFESLLLDVRMHHAMALLQTTSWSLVQVAEACGYLASTRFSQRFRERFGCAPSQVR